MESNIKVYMRLRPSILPPAKYTLLPHLSKIEFQAPKNDQSVVNNQKDQHEFSFNGVLDQGASQEQVFEVVAQDQVRSVLEGYNGCIFAYGQTGSGKTYSMTGAVESDEDRGVIPRVLTMIFDEVKKRENIEHQIRVTYLELYNENGYDLLDNSQGTKTLEELPKVTMLEDENGEMNLRNLSVHEIQSEEEGLNLLFLGEMNRIISETPLNQASTRSHCIFTVEVEARDLASDVVRRSRLHLVDLAGSERVAKSNASGLILKEARYINLSLHYLEQVIVSLQGEARNRVHIPYRNSMMTMMLRDSLGGNCQTSMLATVNVDKEHLDETLSTARFAMRVANVKNEVRVNESVDPSLVIRRLQNEVELLKEELWMAQTKGDKEGEEDEDHEEITEDSGERCEAVVRMMVEGAMAAAEGSGEGIGVELIDGLTPNEVKYCMAMVVSEMVAARAEAQTIRQDFDELRADPSRSFEGKMEKESREEELLLKLAEFQEENETIREKLRKKESEMYDMIVRLESKKNVHDKNCQTEAVTVPTPSVTPSHHMVQEVDDVDDSTQTTPSSLAPSTHSSLSTNYATSIPDHHVGQRVELRDISSTQSQANTLPIPPVKKERKRVSRLWKKLRGKSNKQDKENQHVMDFSNIHSVPTS